jgi:hypothetical protein
MARLNKNQADLCDALNARRRADALAHGRPVKLIQPKTISSIVRGFHTQTRLIAEIAAVLGVPIEAILVSPEDLMRTERRRALAAEVTELVLRALDERSDGLAPAQSVSDAIKNLDLAVRARETPPQDVAVPRPPRKRSRFRRRRQK